MAYDRQKLYDEAIHLIPSMNLVFMYEVYDELGIDKTTFYDIFKADTEESNTFKRLLRQNKASTKRRIREKLEDGKGAELIGLYKLLGNEDELRALNGQYIDHTSKGEKVIITPLQFNDNAKEVDD